MRNSLAAVALLTLTACFGSKREPRIALPEVTVWGGLRAIMHEGKTDPVVSVGDSMNGPDVFAVGALSQLRGEITIVRGTAWISYSEPGGHAVVKSGRSNEAAALLITARVPSWKSVRIPRDVGPDEIDDRLEGLARASGVDVEKAFPVLIEGGLVDVDWHVIDGSRVKPGGKHEDHRRAAVTGTLRSAEASLVGFFSKHHQGVFTHMGHWTHFHVLSSDQKVMGHADRVVVRAGSILKLPARTD